MINFLLFGPSSERRVPILFLFSKLCELIAHLIWSCLILIDSNTTLVFFFPFDFALYLFYLDHLLIKKNVGRFFIYTFLFALFYLHFSICTFLFALYFGHLRLCGAPHGITN
ncbi:hypothetical protein BX661DRAFT_75803 [Kickxella alabastrina]|uniref:uncharacterized protein n=1 Tax=Kickxella alabastrina TaxID=61397 RepID=UPI002220B4F8|nr:uncharacterized protein BX661DRAFT_75803 [Kickxella alabastrina]KAI7833483.1 hypothetical protein BX661DRAFT_75803 [Kickxella alabastrina]